MTSFFIPVKLITNVTVGKSFTYCSLSHQQHKDSFAYAG